MRKMYSKKSLSENLSWVVEKIKDIGGDRVRFIVLYGSYGSASKGKLTDFSDIDLAVFYDGDMEERFEFRIKILGRVGDEFDIQTFQDLPLYIQKEIVSTGDIIFFRDYEEVFSIYLKTVREFEFFKPRLEMYYSALGV